MADGNLILHLLFHFEKCLVYHLNSFSCILLKFVLLVASNQFSDKFNNGGFLIMLKYP